MQACQLVADPGFEPRPTNQSVSRASGMARPVPHSSQRVDAESLLSFKGTTGPGLCVSRLPRGSVEGALSTRGVRPWAGLESAVGE